jgi:predicted TIM-barrel fold metal-dependent hydrolase
MKGKRVISRRSTLKGIGALGAAAFLGARGAGGEESSVGPRDSDVGTSDVRKQIFEKVFATTFVDTHEHLIDEEERLRGTKHPFVKSDDWSEVFMNYLGDEMCVAGMSDEDNEKFTSPEVDPLDKWRLLEPYWPAIKNTGYGQAIRIAVKELYGVEEVSSKTVKQIQAGYEKVRRPGFYKHILCDLAKIESCQVNYIDNPFKESSMPTFLMQDLCIWKMFEGPDFEQCGKRPGIKVSCLADWHKVIDWWFEKYGKYAMAVKSLSAYSRKIDYAEIDAEKAAPIFKKKLDEQSLTPEEKKLLEDHLFWYSVKKATESQLPVKLHTGYHAGRGYMPLSWIQDNPSSATALCRKSPETKFVFMHICYPYYEEMITIAKHYPNAYVDMCWAWLMNPVAAKDFLKKYLVTAPANKVLTFGGDYVVVEPVLGHATMARRGMGLALSELVEEGWLSLDDALELTDPIMHGNARSLFNLDKKTQALKNIKWSG